MMNVKSDGVESAEFKELVSATRLRLENEARREARSITRVEVYVLEKVVQKQAERIAELEARERQLEAREKELCTHVGDLNLGD